MSQLKEIFYEIVANNSNLTGVNRMNMELDTEEEYRRISRMY
jgi:hypothetical protein